MASLFSTIKKYAGSWNLVEEFTLSMEDKGSLDCTAVVVKSTFGRSFCFFGKGNSYKQYIPINDRSAVIVGQRVNINDIKIQKLEKDGNIIFRCMLVNEL